MSQSLQPRAPRTPAREPRDELRDDARSASRELAAAVGTNLRRLRLRRGLSLERLSQRAGVSRAMLGQIELGQSTPTIGVLWLIARALEVTFSALISSKAQGAARIMRRTEAKWLGSQDRVFQSRALFPMDQPRRVEFYQLELGPGGEERASAHPPGTTENLVLLSGSLEIGMKGVEHELAAGDAIFFEADVPHFYRNPGRTPAVMYLVMTYGEDVG
jgi:transcriptional regulator with XRE-family HTH domain